jgi:Rod binding domain-containing protein
MRLQQTPAVAARPLSLQSYLQKNTLQSLKIGTKSADNKGGSSQAELAAACRSFEAFMIGEMLKTMRGEGASERGILAASRGEKIFIQQQCEALGEVMAAREPLGIARLLQQSLTERPR